MTDFFPWRPQLRARLRRLETWDSKRREAGWQKRYEKSRAKKRTKELKRTRKTVSLARGLKDFRKKRGLSQEQLSKELGINRRSLCNYESGLRPVPGDVLEKVVSRGDVELSDIFGLAPEAPHIEHRFDDARLAISLLAACLEEHRSGPLDEIITEVIVRTGNWPRSLKLTEHSVKRIAARLMHDMAQRQWDAEVQKEMDDANFVSELLKGPTDKALAESVDLQFHLLQQSYATGDDRQFEAAITRVAAARRKLSTGVLELVYSQEDHPAV